MKTRIFAGSAIMIALLLLAVLSAPVHGQAAMQTINGALSITDLSVTPTPVIAGSNITVSFRLYNSYTEPLSDVNLALSSTSRIINVSPSNSYLINSMGTGLYGGIGYDLFTYTFHIPSTLTPGPYVIDVNANYQTSSQASSSELFGESTMPITIYVYGKPQINFNVVPQSALVPGSPFDITLYAVNTGTDTATNVTATILNSNAFQVSGQNQFNFGTINAGGEAEASTSLQVESTISSSVHNITLEVTYSGDIQKYSTMVKVPISVALGSPNIQVSVASAMPQQLYTGSNQTLTLLIQNIGNGIARNVTIMPESSRSISVQSSAANFFIGSIPAGGSVEEQLLISANSSMYANSSSLPVSVSYENANYNNKTTVSEKLPVVVAPGALFTIESVNDSVYPGSAYSPITMRIKNTGNEAAQQITFSLQTIYPISPVAGDAYLSSLAPGQTANVTFYVSADQNGAEGNYPVTVYEQWKQPNTATSELFSGSNNYFAIVYSSQSSAAQANSNSSSDYYEYVIAIIVVVAIIAIAVRMYRKRSAKAKKVKTKGEK